MKMSRTAIKELTAAYRAVLKRAFFAAMGAVMVVGGASAGDRTLVAEDELYPAQDGMVLDIQDKEVKDLGDWSETLIFVGNDKGLLTVGAGSVFKNNLVESGIFYTAKPKAPQTGGMLIIGANTVFDGNMAKDSAGAIADFGTVIVSSGTQFNNNSAYATDETTGTRLIGGGAIAMGINGKLVVDGAEFNNNTSRFDGGAIATRRTLEDSEIPQVDNLGNYIKISNSVFSGNQALGGMIDTASNRTRGGNGGAIANTFLTTEINNTRFENNSAAVNGGAVYNHHFIKTDAKGTDSGLGGNMKFTDASFIGNSAAQKGGAIYNDMGDITLNGKTVFSGNVAKKDGGAIYNNRGNLTVGSGAVFSGNMGASGGVAYLTGRAADSGVKSATFGDNILFDGNVATSYAGALYQVGLDLRIGDGAVFSNNSAKNSGGAIYSYAAKGDADTELTLGAGATFRDNTAGKHGGALYVYNKINLNIGDNARFVGNSANLRGGAIYFVNTLSDLNLNGAIFRNNSAMGDENQSAGGAIFVSKYLDSAKNDTVKNVKITNSLFDGNVSAAAGGAILQEDGSKAEIQIEKSAFTNNQTGSEGGALVSDATMTVSDSIFEGNSTTRTTIGETSAITDGGGGAIFLYDQSNTTVKNSEFNQNTSGTYGGAIATRIGANSAVSSLAVADSVFRGNTARVAGGAIYNTVGMTLAGNNVFTGNMAGGVANDIHNVGALNITDGTTTIDGGITGTGTLTVADGATLNIGTSTVEQGTLRLDGTVGLTIVDANNYGKLLADTYFDDATTGRVSLTVATTGTYKIFNEGVNYTIVDAGAIYDVAQDDLGTGLVVISTKKVEDIAADTGLTDQAANIVAGLANGNGDAINAASLKVQQALRDGDTDYIEGEVAKTNPLDKPVVQSVAQSMQGQVMTIAANRLAGAPAHTSIGRNGGDARPEYGVWAQGLFNRSKFNGQFNGYTRGIAAGFDTQIDKQYTVGLGYAYGHSDVHANDRDTEIDTNSIFAYAQYKPTQWYINAALNYSMAQYTGSERSVFGAARIKSDYDVNAFGGQVATGYDFASGMTPEVGVRYLHVSQDSYNNGLVNISSDDTNFLTGTAGLKYRFAIENNSAVQWAPELRAAATYDFVSDSAMSTVTIPGAASYVVDGGRLSRFGGEFGIGLTAEYNGLEISLVYDLDLHQDYTSQTGMAKFRYEF